MKTTISDVVAVNDHEFLVDERDGKGLGDDSNAVFKRIYRIDLTGATDVSAISGAAALTARAVPKTLFLDVVQVLTNHLIAPASIPAKLEGIAFGQDVLRNGSLEHTFYIANDNDFLATVKKGGATADNPNQIFVFAFDDFDLPGYEPQQFRPGRGNDDEPRDGDR